ncbi:MAG TPA: 7-carboxy-7-deazaguanine synthase QueE [Abditibacterium sp.]
MQPILISEIFGPTIQGEGALVGRPTVFVRTGGCDFRCAWCVAPDTQILLADLSQKLAGEISIGDEIVGLERRSNVPEAIGGYKKGKVIGVSRRRASIVKLTAEDGRILRVAADHALVRFKTGRFQGASLIERGQRFRALQAHTPWCEDEAYRVGYLAGAADGDGSFHPKIQPGIWHFVIATKDDAILQRFQRYACALGFELSWGRHLSGGQFAPAYHLSCLRLTRTLEVQRFRVFLSDFPRSEQFYRGYFAGIYDTDGSQDRKTLAISQIKPAIRTRIIECLNALKICYREEIGGFRLLGGLSTTRRVLLETRPALERKVSPLFFARGGHSEFATFESVEKDGEDEVVSIKTTLGTYVSNGFVSRNCDTLYAVLPQYKVDWKPQSASEIIEQVEILSGGFPILITLSGGNPALQPLEPLLELGHARGHTFALETQGSRPQNWFSKLDHLVLSPKPPSSEMKFEADKLAACVEAARQEGTALGPHLSLKIVVFDEDDYQFAREVSALHPDLPFYLSVGNPSPQKGTEAEPQELTQRLEWLLARAARDGWFSATISPQLHVLLWGNKRGV